MKAPLARSIDTLKQRLREYTQLNATLAILQWDQEVHMPEEGADERARLLGYLSTLAHEKLLHLNDGNILTSLQQAEKNLDKKTATIVRETWRSYRLGKKLSSAFIQELTEVCSRAQHAWAEARQREHFKSFLPHLKKIIALKRQEAKLLGYKHSPYDALIETYEPGMTTKELDPIFDELRKSLPSLLKQIQKKQGKVPLQKILGTFPLEEQKRLNTYVAEHMGFNFKAGRMDVSTHPFTTNFHPKDVRFTTRFAENNLLYSIGSTMHETGHALYEQGMKAEHFGTPLTEAISLGIHESQSRMWENNIGKGRPFWQFLYPKLQKQFPKPFKSLAFEEFYRIINHVTPSFIRTEADEVTYNLHILLRYELEKDLIEGKIKADDLPKIWNKKMKDYFGLSVPNDRLGVLQDVHWSAGLFGYFPTYTLGNLYAAQFYAAAQKAIPDLDKQLQQGQCTSLREWLRKNIHVHGKYHTAKSLVQRVTGESLNSQFFIEYLTTKYDELSQR